jgi:2-aminoethylphosphonate-pyruvate transaminase
MLDIARIYNLNVTEFKPNPLAAIPIEDLEDIIKKETITHLALIHHETSTGLLNDLSPIASLVKKHKLVCCVDAMSSFGAVPLDMHTDAIDFCAASSNKNIQGTAGLSFVISKKTSLAAIQTNTKRTLYLDLASQTHYSNTHNQFQFTPPVQTLYALREALLDLHREGVSNRYKRYQLLWTQLHGCFTTLGFKHIIDTSSHGKLITAYVVDETMTFSFDHFHDFLYRNHITIYPGKMGNVSTFRIANIGALSLIDITHVCDIIDHYFKTFPLFK